MKNSNRPKTRPDDRKQAAAFRKAARELGAEATDEQFQGALRKIAKHKPETRPKATDRRKP
jgi:hypothetical protein